MGRRNEEDNDDDEHRRDKKSKKEKKEESTHDRKKKSRDDREYDDAADDEVKKSRRRRDEEDDLEDRRRSKNHRKKRYDDDDEDDDDEDDRRKKKSKRDRDDDDVDDDDLDRRKSRQQRRYQDDDEEEEDDDDRRHKKKSKRYRDDDEEEDDYDDDRRRRDRKGKDRHRRRDDSPEQSRNRDSSSRRHKSSKQIATAASGASLVSLGRKFGKPPPKLIDPEIDYFEYHKHLWVYLFREEGKFFNDLTSDESHEAFSRFAERFNNGDLEASYYCNNGLPQEAIDECRTTAHVWSFATNDQERQRLQVLQEGVRKQTEYEPSSSAADGGAGVSNAADAPFLSAAVSAKEAVRDSTRTTTGQPSHERGTPSTRRMHDLIRTAEEELAGGRKDGRERQLEAKKELSAKIHGAAREKEEMVGAIELGDDALYGDGKSDFQTALARERQRTAQRQENKDKRIAELQQKDQEKQKAMLEKLGLTGIQPGQKITIAPRKDPEI